LRLGAERAGAELRLCQFVLLKDGLRESTKLWMRAKASTEDNNLGVKQKSNVRDRVCKEGRSVGDHLDGERIAIASEIEDLGGVKTG
jgi:hypothetical protein